jgi:hypothetical protein
LLFQAAESGYLQLVHAAQRERQQLPTFSLPKSSVPSSLSVDSKANAILNQCGIYNVGTPYKVYSDGGCLFDSVSVFLISTQDLSQELRVRACIVIITMKDQVMSLPIASNLPSVAPIQSYHVQNKVVIRQSGHFLRKQM